MNFMVEKCAKNILRIYYKNEVEEVFRFVSVPRGARGGIAGLGGSVGKS